MVIAAALLLVDVPREVVAEEYMLSEGADRSAIETAIEGILGGLPALPVDRKKLRAALVGGRRGG